MELSSLQSINNEQKIVDMNPSAKIFKEGFSAASENQSPSFKDTLRDGIREVGSLLEDSEEKTIETITGRNENIHEAMIATEKAETAVKFMTQIRNKALEAYNDILRMQF